MKQKFTTFLIFFIVFLLLNFFFTDNREIGSLLFVGTVAGITFVAVEKYSSQVGTYLLKKIFKQKSR